MLIRPGYITDGVCDPVPKYKWPHDDAFNKLFGKKKIELVDGNMTFSPVRVRFALYLAMGEWILFRLEKHGKNFETLNHFIEALWASNVDQRYYYEGTEEWQYGTNYLWTPLERKQDADDTTTTAVVELGHCLQVGYNEFMDDKLIPAAIPKFCYFVRHVIPDAKVFSVWFEEAFERVSAFVDTSIREPVSAEHELLDFHDERRPRNGYPIPREVFVPGFVWDRDRMPEQCAEFTHAFLQKLDFRKNPFLASPDIMRKRGFKGTPYTYSGPQD